MNQEPEACKHGIKGYCPACEYENKPKPPARDFRTIKKQNKRGRK